MIKTISYLAVGMACFALLGGCSNKEKAFEGKWTFKSMQLPAGQESNPMVKMAQGMMNSSTLDITEDHKYTMTVLNQPIIGEWALSGTTISMTPKTIAGQTVEQLKTQLQGMAKANPMLAKQDPGAVQTGTLSDDAKTLSIGGGAGGGLTFAKTAP